MGELIRANVAMRDPRPLAGSRMHYSLVDGGKWQAEECQDKEHKQSPLLICKQRISLREIWKQRKCPPCEGELL